MNEGGRHLADVEKVSKGQRDTAPGVKSPSLGEKENVGVPALLQRPPNTQTVEERGQIQRSASEIAQHWGSGQIGLGGRENNPTMRTRK